VNENNPLTLVVLNSEQLDINSQVQHRFDHRGGTLGAQGSVADLSAQPDCVTGWERYCRNMRASNYKTAISACAT